MSDPGDMTDRYNTPLSDEEQKAYRAWLEKLSQEQGRDVSRDVRDYDMQGAFKAGEGQSENGHFTDKFKKPSHPTFSDQSKYHGVDGNQGGTWKDLGNGKWEFRPGATNLKLNTPASIQEYLNRSDPGVKLMLDGVQ